MWIEHLIAINACGRQMVAGIESFHVLHVRLYIASDILCM